MNPTLRDHSLGIPSSRSTAIRSQSVQVSTIFPAAMRADAAETALPGVLAAVSHPALVFANLVEAQTKLNSRAAWHQSFRHQATLGSPEPICTLSVGDPTRSWCSPGSSSIRRARESQAVREIPPMARTSLYRQRQRWQGTRHPHRSRRRSFLDTHPRVRMRCIVNARQ